MDKANLFNSVKMFRPKSSAFDLTHDVKLSCNMGELVPICCLEAVPGDMFSIGCESLVRFQPLVAPVMHRFDITMHYFFCPNRLVWQNWENYITNTEIGSPAALPAFPTLTFDDPAQYTALLDYLGIPPIIEGEEEIVSAIPFAAYLKIFNEYYRDQNLIPETDSWDLTDGSNNTDRDALSTLRKRAWEHDYFTSALPFAQKGLPAEVPIGSIRLKPDWLAGGNIPAFEKEDGVTEAAPGNIEQVPGFLETSGEANMRIAYDPKGSLVSDAVTINDLRRAFRLQEFLEKNARGGTRYIENIRAHFGVQSSDKRLQRPEYITGIKSPIVISEVVNTTGTEDLPQGNMAGHAAGVVSGKYGKYFCEEHGYVIGIMSIMPKTAYQQGIPKHFLKTSDPFEFYWPSFANIGEQEVLNKEIFAFQGATGNDPFGYVPRYAEYKYENNKVAGDFRDTLNYWHAGRIFAAPPALNDTFISSDPTHRIFAVTDPAEQKMLVHVLNKIKAIRRMPKFGTPTF